MVRVRDRLRIKIKTRLCIRLTDIFSVKFIVEVLMNNAHQELTELLAAGSSRTRANSLIVLAESAANPREFARVRREHQRTIVFRQCSRRTLFAAYIYNVRLCSPLFAVVHRGDQM